MDASSSFIQDGLYADLSTDLAHDELDESRFRGRPVFAQDDSAISHYFCDLSRIPMLSHEETIQLARQIRQNGPQAEQAKAKLIKGNLRLVVYLAKKQINRGVPIEDLIQEGNIGLIHAAQRFDPERGYKFSTYAVWWVRQAISKCAIEQGRLIKLRQSDLAILRRANACAREQLAENGVVPSTEQLASLLGLRMDRLQEVLAAAAPSRHLDSPVYEGEDTLLGDTIADPTQVERDQEAEIEAREKVELLLAKLNQQEREILRLRSGLKDGIEYTPREIAKLMKLTEARVIQVMERARLKLQHSQFAADINSRRRAPSIPA